MIAIASKMTGLFALLGVVLIFVQEAVGGANELARGFNEDIDWVSLSDGLTLAQQQNKPLMVLIHKSWCGSCKKLKPKFSASQDILQLSRDFIMVNIMDEEENQIGSVYAPDGAKYIPRILFTDVNGHVHTEIFNQLGNSEYKYYYYEPAQISASMRRAKDSLGNIRAERQSEL